MGDPTSVVNRVAEAVKEAAAGAIAEGEPRSRSSTSRHVVTDDDGYCSRGEAGAAFVAFVESQGCRAVPA
jgi:hypothetical protein